ncbi:hypothetical protein EAG_05729 [Camponotus floridanus]|uniref:Uncharacterized protein n=1 Tax=Camponotus floridanus TaxID=104421 RepID=E2AN22_CAMFO|nr:uncharacterized protein LOC105254212 [Camponotus floridanus]EFN65180.1 hypothetical protein EAG_05729 [Camponotus floridanus]
MENNASSIAKEDQYIGAFLKNGIIRGITYQIKFLTWATWKMISKENASKWWLGSEVYEARGFHDLVLKYVNDAVDEDGKTSDKKYMYRFVQIKHMACLTGGTKISMHHLLSVEKEQCQYSLLYLFKSYVKMIGKFENITPEQIVDMTVFTNRNIHSSLEFLVPVDNDEIFSFEGKGKRYRFNLDVLRTISNPIIKYLRTISNNETYIWDFLSKLVFAVGQPSEPELEELVVKDMGRVYNTPQIFYNDLFKNVLDWFLILEKNRAPYLTEERVRNQLKKLEDMLLTEKETTTHITADSLTLSNLLLS